MFNVLINPKDSQKGSGLSVFRSWRDSSLHDAFVKMLNVNPKTERIAQIEVTSDGVTARLEHIPGKGK